MSEDGSRVQVALRIRPLVSEEQARGCRVCVEQVPRSAQVRIRDTEHAFTFNHVFGPDCGQQLFYDTCVRQLVRRLFDGYNVTILAYGQTSSGKTYSMGTSCFNGEHMGVIPRAVRDIFSLVSAGVSRGGSGGSAGNSVSAGPRPVAPPAYHVSVSYMELYQEQLFDLLAPSRCPLDVREDATGVCVPGLTELAVASAEETTELLSRGSSWRATGSTAMNAQSSRSHAIFTITLRRRQPGARALGPQRTHQLAQFHLVDLAGSERQNKAKSTGERLKEGICINRGLLALGNVISALGGENQKGHIGYRNSKLTRLLQNSLGGNSLTLLIACVSPADYNLSETLNTLRYANRAKQIKNRPVVSSEEELSAGSAAAGSRGGAPAAGFCLSVEAAAAAAVEEAELRLKVQELRLQLLSLDERRQMSAPGALALREAYARLVRRNLQLAQSLNATYNDNISLAGYALMAEVEKQRVQAKIGDLLASYSTIIRNEYSPMFRCWDGVLWLDLWKKSILYAAFSVALFIRPHRLWLSSVAGLMLVALAILYLVLACRGRMHVKETLLQDREESYDRFDDLPEVVEDSLPGPGHDSLEEQDVILEM